MHPYSESHAASIDALASRTCPGPGMTVTGTSSLPVEMIPTTGFFATVTIAQPHAASTPASCGVSRRARPEDDLTFFKILVPQQDILTMGNRFFDKDGIAGLLGIFHHHGRIGTFREDAPGWYVRTLAVPQDQLRVACSHCDPSHVLEQGGDASPAPVVSDERTAYPSTTERSNPGISVSAATGAASTRPADCSTGTVSVAVTGAIFTTSPDRIRHGNNMQEPVHLKQPG